MAAARRLTTARAVDAATYQAVAPKTIKWIPKLTPAAAATDQAVAAPKMTIKWIPMLTPAAAATDQAVAAPKMMTNASLVSHKKKTTDYGSCSSV